MGDTGGLEEGNGALSNVELIVAALSAGAAAGLTDTASAAVRDTYASLKRLLRPRLRGDAAELLDAEETDPDFWESRLGEELTDSGAVTDVEILAAASRLLELAGLQVVGKYRVEVSESKGVQIGDHSTQTNHF